MSSFADSPSPYTPSEVHALPGWMTAGVDRAPLYRNLTSKEWPVHSHAEDDLVTAVNSSRDPLGGRGDPQRTPVAFIQAAQGLPVFFALDRDDLGRMAHTLAGVWRSVGVDSEEVVLLHDYATSPLVTFASRSFIPHLRLGAADLVGAIAICNDGLPELAKRCVHCLNYAQPATLFIDGESVEPLIRAIEPGTPLPRRVVVSSDESVYSPEEVETWRGTLSCDVVQIVRADAALFLAPPCPFDGGVFHPSDSYRVEVASDGKAGSSSTGFICISNLAVRSTVVARYVSALVGRIRRDPCNCGHQGTTVVLGDT